MLKYRGGGIVQNLNFSLCSGKTKQEALRLLKLLDRQTEKSPVAKALYLDELANVFLLKDIEPEILVR